MDTEIIRWDFSFLGTGTRRPPHLYWCLGLYEEGASFRRRSVVIKCNFSIFDIHSSFDSSLYNGYSSLETFDVVIDIDDGILLS